MDREGPTKFISRPNSAEAHRENFQRYITGYPWIVIAADKGGNLRYHCAICWRVATMTHILTDHHIERACHHFTEPLRRTIHASLDDKVPERRHQ